MTETSPTGDPPAFVQNLPPPGRPIFIPTVFVDPAHAPEQPVLRSSMLPSIDTGDQVRELAEGLVRTGSPAMVSALATALLRASIGEPQAGRADALALREPNSDIVIPRPTAAEDSLAAEWEAMLGGAAGDDDRPAPTRPRGPDGEEQEGTPWVPISSEREATRVLNADEIDSLLGFDEAAYDEPASAESRALLEEFVPERDPLDQEGTWELERQILIERDRVLGGDTAHSPASAEAFAGGLLQAIKIIRRLSYVRRLPKDRTPEQLALLDEAERLLQRNFVPVAHYLEGDGRG